VYCTVEPYNKKSVLAQGRRQKNFQGGKANGKKDRKIAKKPKIALLNLFRGEGGATTMHENPGGPVKATPHCLSLPTLMCSHSKQSHTLESISDATKGVGRKFFRGANEKTDQKSEKILKNSTICLFQGGGGSTKQKTEK